MVIVAITSYNRPQMLSNLIGNLLVESLRSVIKVQIRVYDDCSNNEAINGMGRLLNDSGHHFISMDQNLGKKGFWKLNEYIYKDVTRLDYDVFIQLPDDVTLVSGFFSKALHILGLLKDKGKHIINILTLMEHIEFYGKYNQPVLDYKGVRYIDYNSVDCCFICNKEVIDYMSTVSLEVPTNTWDKDPHRGSGVNNKFTGRAVKGRFRIAHLYYSLVRHIGQDSNMNPLARKENPCYSHLSPGDN